MNKYTIKDLKEHKIVIHLTNKQQAHKLMDAWELTNSCSRHDFCNSNNFTIMYDTQYNLRWVNEKTHPNYFENNGYGVQERIEFSQIDFQEQPIELINEFIIF